MDESALPSPAFAPVVMPSVLCKMASRFSGYHSFTSASMLDRSAVMITKSSFLFNDFSSAASNIKPAHGGAAAAVHRPHSLEVEDKGHLKYFVVIFVFVEVLCIVRCFY
jgi:hypothetical protein